MPTKKNNTTTINDKQLYDDAIDKANENICYILSNIETKAFFIKTIAERLKDECIHIDHISVADVAMLAEKISFLEDLRPALIMNFETAAHIEKLYNEISNDNKAQEK